MPQPSIFITPPSGAGGRDITIRGSNFQPDQNVFLEFSGVVVNTVQSDAEGRFNAQIFVPISGEGSHQVRAVDASGNVAGTSFYMSFGFDNIQGSIQDIVGQLDSLGEGLAGTGDTEPSVEVSAQLQALQDSLSDLGQIQTTLSGLDQLPGIQTTLQDLEAREDSSGTATWIVVVIAALAALGGSSLGLVAGLRVARGRPTT